jgi:hypothetical protein
MTDEELAIYYADLLILQYRGKERAYATIEALALLGVVNQLPLTVQDAFDLDTAVGVQLDVLGKYVGVSRNGYTFSAAVVLTDDEYRLLIKVAIVRNYSGSSLKDIQDLLFQFFPETLLVFDYLGMRISYFFNASIGSQALAEVFVESGVLPKPMGVEMGVLVYSFDIDNFFGCQTYLTAAHNVHGFNTYTVYDMDAPWLNSADILTP